MTTIDFSYIVDSEADYANIVQLMSDFKRETGIEVNIKRMEWGDAWQQLITIATKGVGADISHVGSTWVSSLVVMDALRPISKQLVNRIGGEQVFVHSTWSNVFSTEHRDVYGVPLSAYSYVVAYRKDLLAKAGLHSGSAFATPAALEATVQKLDALNAVENTWLMPIAPHPFNDIVHMAASWVWSSGGHFMDNRGGQVLFNSPATLAGLKSYLALLRRGPKLDYLGQNTCMEMLLNGKAAAVITDARAVMVAAQNRAPNIENIGAASLMGIPWTGGGSVVVWRHTHGYPDRLEASFKLVEFLARKQTMLEFARNSSYTMPSRTDALDELFPPDHILRAVMLQLVSTGRSYRPIPLWHRIEYQFGEELQRVANELMQNPKLDLDTTVTRAMTSLSERLNLTLG
ncbi:MAG: extracellular solute-binding protein [Anaerolineales bacterium]|nr:extracellular solute-binding protein [Anaerolineales bacterium]